jgi:hypothetical protein
VWQKGLSKWKFQRPIGNRTRDIPHYGAVPHPTVLHLDYLHISEGNSLRFVQPKNKLPWSHGPSIACLLRSTPAGNNYVPNFFKIHINTIVFLRIFSPSCAFDIGFPGKVFNYFLTATRATDSGYLFFDTTKRAVRHPRHWVVVSLICRWKFLLYLRLEKLNESFWPFEKCENIFSKSL